MDVFIVVQRYNQSIFIDAKDKTLVREVKNKLSYIIKVGPNDQELFFNGVTMNDSKTLFECGITNCIFEAHNPAFIGLALRKEDGEFESLDVEPYI